MDRSIPTHLRSAYGQCARIASSHYENFPVASLLLTKGIRPHVAALYAFSRKADDLADEPPPYLEIEKKTAMSPEALARGDEKKITAWRLKELAEWERGLRAALKGKPAPLELQAFSHTLNTFQIPLSLPLDLLKAFRMDAVGHRYNSWGSLLYYCRHSADPVGRMVLLLHGIREEKLHRYSDFICTGLQLINFWQDTTQDLERGRIYFPKDLIKKHSVREKDLLLEKDSPGLRDLARQVTDETENHFRRGFPLLDSLSGRLQLELRATCLGGLGILKKIRKTDYNILQQRPRLGSSEKILIALKALLGSRLKGKP